MSTEDAVAHGIKATASVVTSAALVMVAVFSIFATLAMIDFKMMGVGLAVAVLLDATIVRAVLLPAAMKLLGDWNWYLPRWLQRLPQMRIESPAPRSGPARPPTPSLPISAGPRPTARSARTRGAPAQQADLQRDPVSHGASSRSSQS